MRLLLKTLKRDESISAYEEVLFQSRLKNETQDVVWLIEHPKTIYLLHNASINYVNPDYAKNCGYTICRSSVFDGKQTSIVIAGNDWGVMAYVDKKNYLLDGLEGLHNLFYVNLWKHVTRDLDVKLEHKGNDLVIEGTDRKILGMVGVEKNNILGGHCMFSETIPSGVDLELLFNMPPEKFEGKEVKDVSSRITSLETEIGNPFVSGYVVEKVKEYFSNLGIEIENSYEFNNYEQNYFNEVISKHTDEKWVNYGDYWTDDFKE